MEVCSKAFRLLSKYLNHHTRLLQVTMGCNVVCPHIPGAEVEDWGLDDPTGQADEVFMETIKIIEEKVLDLKRRMEENV